MFAGGYQNRTSICSNIFKPTEHIFKPSCQSKTARGFWDETTCNYNTSYDQCSSFHANKENVLTGANNDLWCRKIQPTPDWRVGYVSTPDGLFSQGLHFSSSIGIEHQK